MQRTIKPPSTSYISLTKPWLFLDLQKELAASVGHLVILNLACICAMEFYGRKPLRSFLYEEEKVMQSPNPCAANHEETCEEDLQDVQFSPATPSSPDGRPSVTASLPPSCSPGSPWTLSPRQSPSSSLLYHCIASLHRHEGNVYAITVSKGLVFTGTSSSRIRAWKQPDCMERGYLKSSSGEVRAILAYGNTLFSAHKDNRIRIWSFTVADIFRSKKLSTLPRRSPFPLFTRTNNFQHKDFVSCLAYYHADGLLYTGSHDRTVKAWRVSDGKCVDSFAAHEDYINAIMVNQDDGCVFSCSSDASVKIWRRIYRENSHTLTLTLRFQASPINAMALSSAFNNYFLYAGCSDGVINFWAKDKSTYRFQHGGFLQGHRFAVLCMAAVGKLILSGSEDTTIRVWRRVEGGCYHEFLAVLDGHRGPVRCLAACLEMEKVVMGFLVYSASMDQTFKVWRLKVLPDDTMWSEYKDRQQLSRSKTGMDYDTSPVLSPSWVEKKLQGDHFQ